MARIRSVFPGLWTDEAYMDLSLAARLLVIGLWTEAWDDGVFEWKPRVLKARLFPADVLDVAPLLEELIAGDIVRRVERGGSCYGLIRNFCKYQRPQKPKRSDVTTPEDRRYLGAKPDLFDTGPGPVADSSGRGSGEVRDLVDRSEAAGDQEVLAVSDEAESSEGQSETGTIPVRYSSDTGHVPVEEGSGNSSADRRMEDGGWKDPPLQQPGSESERDRDRFDRRTADELEARLREAAGYEANPAPNLCVVGPIEMLIGEGFDLETEILPVIRAKAGMLLRPAQSWSYFVGPIREARDRGAGGRPRDAPEQAIERRLAEAKAKLEQRSKGNSR